MSGSSDELQETASCPEAAMMDELPVECYGCLLTWLWQNTNIEPKDWSMESQRIYQEEFWRRNSQ